MKSEADFIPKPGAAERFSKGGGGANCWSHKLRDSADQNWCGSAGRRTCMLHGVWPLRSWEFLWKCSLKGTQMGPLLVLVPPCFTGNVNVTCKIVSFLCSLDNFLLKNVIVFFFGNKNSQWHSFEKRAICGLFFRFFSHHGRHKNSFSTYPTSRVPLTYIHIFCSPYWLFSIPILQKLRIYHVWFLFGATPGVDSFSRHFRAINNKMVSKI